MNTGKHYHTKQQKIILEYLMSGGQSYVTVSQIAAHLKEQGQSVGLTTIYRHLDKFEQEGLVHKIVLDGNRLPDGVQPHGGVIRSCAGGAQLSGQSTSYHVLWDV